MTDRRVKSRPTKPKTAVKAVSWISRYITDRWVWLPGLQLRVARKEGGRAIFKKGNVEVQRKLSRAMKELAHDDTAKVSDLIALLEKYTVRNTPRWEKKLLFWELYNPLTRKRIDGGTKISKLQTMGRPTHMTRDVKEQVMELRTALVDADFDSVVFSMDDAMLTGSGDFALIAMALLQQYTANSEVHPLINDDEIDDLIGMLQQLKSRKV